MIKCKKKKDKSEIKGWIKDKWKAVSCNLMAKYSSFEATEAPSKSYLLSYSFLPSKERTKQNRKWERELNKEFPGS